MTGFQVPDDLVLLDGQDETTKQRGARSVERETWNVEREKVGASMC